MGRGPSLDPVAQRIGGRVSTRWYSFLKNSLIVLHNELLLWLLVHCRRPVFVSSCNGLRSRACTVHAFGGQESAPEWAIDDDRATSSPASVAQVQEDPQSVQSVLDKIISEMAVDPAEVVAERVSAGRMNFEDFIATSMVMTASENTGPLASLPTGYEKIILAMTVEERRHPDRFKGPGSDERINRLASQAGVEIQLAKTFLSDFGSIQQFFAKVQQGRESGKGALRQSMQMAAEYLADKPRRTRRAQENRNKMLKQAGKELRAKKAGSYRCVPWELITHYTAMYTHMYAFPLRFI